MKALYSLLRIDPDRGVPTEHLFHVEAKYMHLGSGSDIWEHTRKGHSMLLDQYSKQGSLVVAQGVLPIEEHVQLAERREHGLQRRSALAATKRTLHSIWAPKAARADD